MPPFQEFTPFFGPDDLEAMQAAYNSAWVQLLAGAASITPQRGEMKNRLAQVILAAACTGKREKERLEDVALRALARRKSAKP